MVTIAPLQTYQGAALDPIGNYNKGMMGALAREEAQMMRDDRSKAQMREEQTQNILSQNLPAEELSRQLLAVNPQMANTILAMENTRQQGALNSQQIRMNDMAMAQQRIQQRKDQIATEAKAAQGFYDALQGVEDPEQKSKIYDLSMRRLEELGLDVPDELKRGWSPENEENLMRIATIGKKMLDLDPANGEQFTLKPGETRFDAQGNVIAEIEDDKNKEAPSGFRFKEGTDELEAIPGGPEDIKIKEAEQKQKGRFEAAKTKAEVVTNTVEETMEFLNKKKMGLDPTGLAGQVTSWIGGTDAYTLDKKLDTIKANLGFEELNKMREMSETGGALGSVQVRELELLQSTLAALDIGLTTDELMANLEKVKEHYTNWLNAFEEAPKEQQDTQGLENYSIEELQQMLEGM